MGRSEGARLATAGGKGNDVPGMVGPIADEREGLLAYLGQIRYVLGLTAYGLSDEQARSAVGPSGLSVGGLIKHCATVEGAWMDTVEQRARGSEQDYENGFRLLPDETLHDARERLDAAAQRTEAIVASVADLGEPVPVP